MESIVWLLPLLFILHDMEEIILAIGWKKKEGTMKRYINLPFVPFGNLNDTASFALGVYEELIILTLASILGYFTGHYELWLGLLVANILHCILMHIIGTTLAYRRYVPGVVTAVLILIPSCIILKTAIEILQYSTGKLIGSIIVGVVVAVVNLKILHQCGDLFERVLKKLQG